MHTCAWVHTVVCLPRPSPQQASSTQAPSSRPGSAIPQARELWGTVSTSQPPLPHSDTVSGDLRHPRTNSKVLKGAVTNLPIPCWHCSGYVATHCSAETRFFTFQLCRFGSVTCLLWASVQDADGELMARSQKQASRERQSLLCALCPNATNSPRTPPEPPTPDTV